MAKLMLIGNRANIEFTVDDEEDDVVATCVEHAPSSKPCGWTERYDTERDAWEYAADHADHGPLG